MTTRLLACRIVACLGALVFLAACGGSSTAATPGVQAGPVRSVAITGYAGIAMEPFISRDGSTLFFNDSNDPSNNTDIFYATRVDDTTYAFAGRVAGLATPSLEGTPTMDRNGRFYFVTTRDYAATSCTLYTARYAAGAASGVAVVDSICRHEPGIVNFDVDIDAAGTLMTFVDGRFTGAAMPQAAELVMAAWDGSRFVRLPDSAALLAAINRGGLQYAPALSADRLTLWFTRLASGSSAPQIWRARRAAVSAAFEAPVHIEGLGDFVEAPALSAGETLLYFHRKEGTGYRIFTVPTPSP